MSKNVFNNTGCYMSIHRRKRHATRQKKEQSTISVMQRIVNADGTITYKEIEKVDADEYKRNKNKHKSTASIDTAEPVYDNSEVF